MLLFSETLYLFIVIIFFSIYQHEEIVPAKLKAMAHFRASAKVEVPHPTTVSKDVQEIFEISKAELGQRLQVSLL